MASPAWTKFLDENSPFWLHPPIAFMNLAALKQRFGDEYPAAVIIETGLRLPLQRERRFSRYYYSKEHKSGAEISRFMDGTASITATELQQEWADWSEDTRLDFCQSSAWLSGQPDFPEMLRYVMQHGGPSVWGAITLSVASELPRDEAFATLRRALQNTGLSHTANLTQANCKDGAPGCPSHPAQPSGRTLDTSGSLGQ
jgi:hypothetical protein